MAQRVAAAAVWAYRGFNLNLGFVDSVHSMDSANVGVFGSDVVRWCECIDLAIEPRLAAPSACVHGR